MAYEWVKTKFLGVRYRLHKSRKHGINFDKCFCVRYKLSGKDKEEVAGWSSEGMTAEKAYKILSEIRENIRTGAPENSLANIRHSKEEARREEERQHHLAAKSQITMEEFWDQIYLQHATAAKTVATIRNECSIYAKWLRPALGTTPISSLRPSHVEQLILHVTTQGKSAQTVRHVIALISQIWNVAQLHDVVSGENPCRRVKKPQQDSRRMRFLTRDEAVQLLQALRARSKDTYDTAVISLFAGLRAGEIHALTWADVNFEAGTLYIRDPKNKHSRHAYISAEIAEILESRNGERNKSDFIFPATTGGQRLAVSDTFENVVKALGLNDGVIDARQKVVFHTLRHTFASWLVQRGTPLYTVAELMGHSSLEMTKRYAHLAPDTMRKAALGLSGVLAAANLPIGCC